MPNYTYNNDYNPWDVYRTMRDQVSQQAQLQRLLKQYGLGGNLGGGGGYGGDGGGNAGSSAWDSARAQKWLAEQTAGLGRESSATALENQKSLLSFQQELANKQNFLPPDLLKMLMGGINKDQGTMDAWLRGMVGTATGQLGGQLGSQFARTNVGVPSGAQAIANRYMSPLGSLIEGNKPMSYADKMMQALSIGKTMAPSMSGYNQNQGGGYGQKKQNNGYQDYMDQIFGKNNFYGNTGGQKKWGRW